MSPDIVLAYTPSESIKDWQCCADGDGNWFYEQRDYIYCRTHKRSGSSCWDSYHKAAIWGTHFLNLKTGRISTKPRRVYITHHPKKGEWEHFKTIDDVKRSKLYAKSRAVQTKQEIIYHGR